MVTLAAGQLFRQSIKEILKHFYLADSVFHAQYSMVHGDRNG
jgi:hypothetical protein